MEPAAPSDAPAPLRGLLLLALANIIAFLVCSWTTAAYYSAWTQLPLAVISLQHAIEQSQRQSYGIVAALVPERRFVGLAWVLGLGLVCGLVQATTLNAISISRNGPPLGWDQWLLRISAPLCETLSVLVLLQVCRYLFSWRLAPVQKATTFRRGQFRVGDLLEWTATIAVLLGIHRLIRVEPVGELHWLQSIVGGAAIIVPFALAITSQRGLDGARVLGLFLWIAAAALFFNVLSYVLIPGAFTLPWSFFAALSIADTVGCVLCTGVNFAMVRRLGFRWVSAPTVLSCPVNQPQ